MLQLSHKNLEVYQLSIKFVKEIYTLVGSFPAEEQYALSRQIKRASVSVCSNIAEGAARISKAEKKRFYEVARSSLVEVDTQIVIALELKYLSPDKIDHVEKFMESIFRILSRMINNLKE